jgi:hypothetical protein
MILAVRRLFLLLPLGLLAACGADRSASTEVENEVSAGVLRVSVEDTALLPGVRWNLSTPSGTVLDSGFANASGILTSSRAPLGQELLLRALSRDTLRAVVIDSSTLDTLRAGMNLLTDAVARQWTSDGKKQAFPEFADSLVRKITGTDVAYHSISTDKDMRSQFARSLLGTLTAQIARCGCPPSAYLDTLATVPDRSLHSDSQFDADIARQYARDGVPLDSQALRLLLPSSDTSTQAHLDSIDIQSFVSALPWTRSGENTLNQLLNDAESIGTAAASSLKSGRGTAATAAARVCLHVYELSLSEIGQSPDSSQRMAYYEFRDKLDSSTAQGLQILGVGSWLSDGAQAASRLHSALISTRTPSWNMATFLNSSNPQTYLQSNWPMPTGEALRQAIPPP